MTTWIQKQKRMVFLFQDMLLNLFQRHKIYFLTQQANPKFVVKGVVMSFLSTEQARRAEEILNQHSEDLQFTTSLPTKSLPNMTLVGVDADITDDKIADVIISHNPAVKAAADNDGFIKVLFSTQYGENSVKRNVIFSCSPNVRNAIKKLNKLYIDFRHLPCYEPCYDRFYFKICYHCNGFNHFAISRQTSNMFILCQKS